jgi:hypothetical protein
MAQKQIEIEVISVGNPSFVKTARGGYNTLEVAYKNLSFSGKVEGKKLVDFTNQALFNEIKALQQGEKVVVTQQKGEEDKYWNWVSIGKGAEAPAQQSLPSTEVTKSETTYRAGRTSTYETSEERARRQIYIVRQSSISAAIAYLEGNKLLDGGKLQDVLDVAKQFEQYVLNVEKSEIPF